MKKYLSIALLISFSFGQIISVVNQSSETIITANSQAHLDYGLSYPATYEFTISDADEELNVYRKNQKNQNWTVMNEKNSTDFFNGIEVVRFDNNENKAYISVGFSIISDSIFIKIARDQNSSTVGSFLRICEFYDNRKAVVTVTADDWADWNNENFVQACQNFRNYNLWLSVAVISSSSSQSTWDAIQLELDNGLIEVVSHSRTHPYIPYLDVQSEVVGSKEDIINNLNLMNHNRSGANEYIYAWIAPYGEYNDDIDVMTSNANYLISRLFYWNDNSFSDWDNNLNKFDPVGASIELGNASYWGETDINELNTAFDNVIDSSGIYHLTTHPNILQWDEDFTWSHLEYISNRKDIWYVGFGHLYLYRFISNAVNDNSLGILEGKPPLNSDFKLYQNYPNPFNPITALQYDLTKEGVVNITIYDMMGRLVKTLVDGPQTAGFKTVQWDATNDRNEPVSAGLYLYTMQKGKHRETGKMVLIK
jgi:peptidoglycan/xylan/chitin deacetylase (PgdA/CDA1 family)